MLVQETMRLGNENYVITVLTRITVLATVKRHLAENVEVNVIRYYTAIQIDRLARTKLKRRK